MTFLKESWGSLKMQLHGWWYNHTTMSHATEYVCDEDNTRIEIVDGHGCVVCRKVFYGKVDFDD